MFAVHGDLAHVKVVYDRSTGKSMGYGFVKFTTNEAATAAIAAVNGMAIDRKRIKVLKVLLIEERYTLDWFPQADRCKSNKVVVLAAHQKSRASWGTGVYSCNSVL